MNTAGPQHCLHWTQSTVHCSPLCNSNYLHAKAYTRAQIFKCWHRHFFAHSKNALCRPTALRCDSELLLLVQSNCEQNYWRMYIQFINGSGCKTEGKEWTTLAMLQCGWWGHANYSMLSLHLTDDPIMGGCYVERRCCRGRLHPATAYRPL